MTFKSGSLKSIITFIIVMTIEHQRSTTGASRIVNVRNTHKLQTRSLLFPPTAPTRVQFIGGIGIPVEDLGFESVTSGYVLKAEYFLPETPDVFHQKIKPQTIHRRRKSANDSQVYEEETLKNVPFLSEKENVSHNMNWTFHHHKKNLQQTDDHFKAQQKHGAFYRWVVYKAIETVLDNSGLTGNICMLRSICEHAAIPLNYEGGLLAEILHIVLTPSTSHDESVRQDHKNYLRAEILGRSGEDCAKAFSLCIKSPLEIISAVFEI